MINYSLTAFPALIVPVLIYAVAALFGGDGFVASLSERMFSISMPAGVWGISLGDLIVLFGIIALFVDLIKSTSTGTAAVVNHALSTGVFIICLILDLLVPAFVSTPFFMLMVVMLLDIVAGFTITTISARRDVSYE
jgi:hypothetical protein